MKKLFLPLLIVITAPSHAQVAKSFLSENFDVACVTAGNAPAGWLIYNPIAGTVPSGAWQCDPLDGNSSAGSPTPGMSCTGYYGGNWHLDTSVLITPKLNLSVYEGRTVYLEFDSRTSNIHAGARLSLMLSRDTLAPSAAAMESTLMDISDGITPVIDNNDSINWVTHTVNLSGLIEEGDFYLAFRYTSTDTSGKVWYLDNVRTVSNLNVINAAGLSLPITEIAGNAPGKISVEYTVPSSGICDFTLYDMMGRRIYDDNINVHKGVNSYTTAQTFPSGAYVVKISSADKYGVARVIIP